MVRKLLLTGLGSSLLLSGCFANTSQVPLATTYPYSEQQKMQAVQHWDVLAEYEAAGILRSDALHDRSLFINPTHANSAFAQSFGNLLSSQLVSNGALVRTDPTNAALVDYRVQLVEHQDRDFVLEPIDIWENVSNQEVIVTTQVRENDRLLYSSSNIYYINGGDAGQYQLPKPLPVTDAW